MSEAPLHHATQPSQSSLEDALHRAIGFLAANQLPDGEFQTEFCPQREVAEDGSVIEHWIFDSSPFVTALLLECLHPARALDPAVESIVAKGIAFLESEQDPGGLWRYWARKNPRRNVISPDLDDTSCISHTLLRYGRRVPDNRGFFYDSRDPRGRFYTWLYKPDSIRKWWLWLRTRGKAFSHTDELWLYTQGSDVCIVVNANVLYYLGDTRGTRPAIDYLLATIAAGREDQEIVFYAHRSSLYYMTSRAIAAGLEALHPAAAAIIERTWAFAQPDGSFGDELVTALGICTLLNLGVSPDALQAQVSYLLATQRANGSWRRVPMYGGPPVPTTFGSADLTTGFCIEALARCTAAR